MVKAINFTILSEQKNVTVRITDPKACALVLGSSLDSDLLEDLCDFAEDVLHSNPDAGLVELDPTNVSTVLKSEAAEQHAAESTPIVAANTEPTSPAEVPAVPDAGASAPAAEVSAVPDTGATAVHEASSATAETPAAEMPAAPDPGASAPGTE